MNQIRAIRSRLGVSQAGLAAALTCSQSNISFYEKGQTVPPDTARLLIEYARGRGLAIGFDHIYGDLELPPDPAEAQLAGEG